MTTQIEHLESMMNKTAQLMIDIDRDQLADPTPCRDFDVRALLEHLATWVQVFDSAVNETALPFDPSDHRIDEGWAQILQAAAARIVSGLSERGIDRPMAMTSDPIPGSFVLNMMLMEYIGHGWDLARATGTVSPFSDAEATVALNAAQTIIQPEHRGTAMFDHPVPVNEDSDPTKAFVAFTGRDPHWAPPTTTAPISSS